jgi:hypothetical protein
MAGTGAIPAMPFAPTCRKRRFHSFLKGVDMSYKSCLGTGLVACLLLAAMPASAGVKEVYDGGVKSSSGSPIYIVKCTSGSSYSVFQKGNQWWDYSGVPSHMGSRYDGKSLNDVANLLCN